MTIKIADIGGGMMLEALYRGEKHVVEVVERASGLSYRLLTHNNELYGDLDGAAAAATNGEATDGESFWSRQGTPLQEYIPSGDQGSKPAEKPELAAVEGSVGYYTWPGSEKKYHGKAKAQEALDAWWASTAGGDL